MCIPQRMLDAIDAGEPVELAAAERATLAYLRAASALKPDEPAHVDRGCAEFGVVHVHGAASGWIELDPLEPDAITIFGDL